MSDPWSSLHYMQNPLTGRDDQGKPRHFGGRVGAREGDLIATLDDNAAVFVGFDRCHPILEANENE